MARLDQSASGQLELMWFGKLPGTGDFLRRDLGCSALIDSLDDWLSQAIHSLSQERPEQLQKAWMERGVMRFELLNAPGLQGILAPSVDSCGRLFPFMLATQSALPLLDKLCDLVINAIECDWTERELIQANQSLKEQTLEMASLMQPAVQRPAKPTADSQNRLHWLMPDDTDLQTAVWPSLSDFEILFGLRDR